MSPVDRVAISIAADQARRAPRAASGLRIALFHNVGGMGPKRAIYQFARGLLARGHTLDLFTLDTANEQFLPLEPLGVRLARRDRWLKAPRVPELWPYALATAVESLARRRFQRQCANAYRRIAANIDAGGYEAVWVDACIFTETPFILPYLQTPSLVYCHEPKREWFERPLRRPAIMRAGRLRAWHTAVAEFWLASERASLIRLASENLACAGRLLTNSQHTRDYLWRAYGAEAQVCYLGVDPDVFHPMPEAARQRSVLMVGKSTAWDRVELVLEALAHLDAVRRPTLVLVCGDQPRESLASLAASAQARGVALQILPHLGDAELARHYAQAGAVVCTAKAEPFGLVAIEAMACGTPVVAVREGGFVESIEDGRTGLLVDAEAEAIGRALSEILDAPARHQAMGQAGIEAVRGRWTWAAAVDRFESHLYDMAARPWLKAQG